MKRLLGLLLVMGMVGCGGAVPSASSLWKQYDECVISGDDDGMRAALSELEKNYPSSTHPDDASWTAADIRRFWDE